MPKTLDEHLENVRLVQKSGKVEPMTLEEEELKELGIDDVSALSPLRVGDNFEDVERQIREIQDGLDGEKPGSNIRQAAGQPSSDQIDQGNFISTESEKVNLLSSLSKE